MDFFTFLFLDTTIPQIIPFYFKGLLLFTQQEIRTLRIRIWLKFPANSGHLYLNRKSHTKFKL